MSNPPQVPFSLAEWKRKPLAERQAEFEKIKKRHPKKVAVLVGPVDERVPPLTKYKFLVDVDEKACVLPVTIRKYMTTPLRSDEGLYYFVQNVMVPQQYPMSQLAAQYADPSGFVLVEYGRESTFG